MKSIFSVDVEDWFHILDIAAAPAMPAWDSLPSRVEKNFMTLLDLFSMKDVRVTCFFLGWVAERYPHLAEEAAGRGHEIASHGYSHKLVYELTEREFLHDAIKSKAILEDIAGASVLGYRSSGFSVTKRTPWFFDKLIEAGYVYDSSVFPAPRGHGGLMSDKFAPYLLENGSGRIIEFPVSVIKILGKPLYFFGGGYLRITPYFILRRMAFRVLNEGRPVIYYVHPREIDPAHPRLPMGMKRKFKSYVNLDSTPEKLKKILDEFDITTYKKYLENNPIT